MVDSIQTKRSNHGELRNVDLEGHTIHNAFHEIVANHFSDAGFQVAPRDILMCLSGFKHRLLSHNTFTFYLALAEAGIVDMPVAAKQLDGVLTVVFDGYPIGEYVMVLAWTRVRGWYSVSTLTLMPLVISVTIWIKSKNFFKILKLTYCFRWNFL